MKLDRFAAIALVAFGCGCSATASTPTRTASVESSESRTPYGVYDAYAVQSATVPNAVGTTNLMSAELAGPAPRVGKAHLAIDEGAAPDDSFDTSVNSDESSRAPKEARRSDGSHRGGSFGTPSK